MSKIETGSQNRIYKAFLFLFFLFVVVFIGRHLWSYLHQPYDTETVGSTTLVDEITLDGFFVRDEIIVEGSDTGVIKCNYEDGQRVKIGSVLSSVYHSKQDQINLQLVEEYTALHAQLEALSAEGAVKGSRIDIIVKQVEQLQSEYVSRIESGNFAKAKEIKESLTYQLNKLQLCKGEVTSYAPAMKKLSDRIDALSANSDTKGSITASRNGYFSGKTDGYEQKLSLKDCDEMSPTDAIKLLSGKSSVSAGMGKIVTSNYWYYCAIAETSELTKKLYVGDTVSVRFGSLSAREYPLELVRTVDDGLGNTLFIFQSSIMNKNFINARFEKASITVATYEGIGISKKALRFQNGEKGVYIVRGSNLLFKKVDAVYEDEDIIISKLSSDAGYVSIFDNVVVGGEFISGNSE